MKKALLVTMFFAVATALGQSSDPLMQKYPNARNLSEEKVRAIEQNYVAALQEKNDGVVESAIARVVEMKMVFPERSFPGIAKTLKKLAFDGNTVALRYRAFLAGIVLEGKPLPKNLADGNESTMDRVFDLIADQIAMGNFEEK